MKIFTGTQIHELDKYTIEHEPVASLDLMERAAKAITVAIMQEWDATTPVVLFSGPGNNGGDALAVGRMLTEKGYQVDAYLFNIKNKLSPDCAANRQSFIDCSKKKSFTEVNVEFDPPALPSGTLVIDGLFGSGINKPLSGGFASLVRYINQCDCKVVSIDLPSGLMTEDNSYNVKQNIIRADLTLTLQTRKLSFLFADCQEFIGRLKVLDIRLSPEYIAQTETRFSMIEEQEVRSLLRPRKDFVNKGSMGNALLIAGSYGMSGASVLATRACLRSGVGKVTVHTPRRNYDVMQISVPEAVLQMDHEEGSFSEAVDTEEFDALGIGPGLGTAEVTSIALISQLRRTQCPIVADADALNIIANHRAWTMQLPKGIILTPHPKEFDRFSGMQCLGDYERLMRASELAERLGAYIILKGHYSALCLPDSHVVFNTTGNSGMATAGSGDVLTGIITGLLARGYGNADACKLGMYLHGLAGDLAAKEVGKESLVAGDIVRYLPKAFLKLED